MHTIVAFRDVLGRPRQVWLPGNLSVHVIYTNTIVFLFGRVLIIEHDGVTFYSEDSGLVQVEAILHGHPNFLDLNRTAGIVPEGVVALIAVEDDWGSAVRQDSNGMYVTHADFNQTRASTPEDHAQTVTDTDCQDGRGPFDYYV